MNRVFRSVALCAVVNLSCILSVEAQTLDDIGRICIHVSPVSDNFVPTEATKVLETRMHQIICSSGLSDNGIDRRFELSADIATISKDVLDGAPSRISQKIEIALTVRDIIEKKDFCSVSVTVVGVGLNETKSYIMAFNSVKSDNKRIQDMLDKAKERIVIYYRTVAESLMQDAKYLADCGEYDEAIFSLCLIPNVCKEEYEECQMLLCRIYKDKINHDGARLLGLARSAWAESPDSAGAQKAVSFLNDISVMADCQKEVPSLLEEITSKIKEDKKKEWEFQLQQYADNKAREQRDFEFNVRRYEDMQQAEAQMRKDAADHEKREHELAMKRQDDEAAYQRAVLEASKEMALVYAKNRK